MDVRSQRASGLLCAVPHPGECLYPASPILALFLTLASTYVLLVNASRPRTRQVFPDGEQWAEAMASGNTVRLEDVPWLGSMCTATNPATSTWRRFGKGKPRTPQPSFDGPGY